MTTRKALLALWFAAGLSLIGLAWFGWMGCANALGDCSVLGFHPVLAVPVAAGFGVLLISYGIWEAVHSER